MRLDPSGWKTRLTDAMVAKYRAEHSWRDRTISEDLDQLWTVRPTQPLVIEPHVSRNVEEVRQDARMLAGALAGKGLRRGDVVSFQLPNWYEAVLIELACAYGGFVCNPIVPIYRATEVDFILRDAGSKIFFVPESFRNFDYAAMALNLRQNCQELHQVVVVRPAGASPALTFQDLMQGVAAPIEGSADPNDVKLIMYTSGTTSRAKGVLHTHNTISTEVHNLIAHMKLDANDVILMPSPLCHITGYLYGVQLPITLGCPVVLMDVWDVAKAVEAIEQSGVTFTIGATPFLQELAIFCIERGQTLPGLRYFPTGGAPVPPEVIAVADKAFARCVAFRVYGSTEAPTVTLGVVDRGETALRAETEGYVVGHEIRLVDDEGKVVRVGDEGEIITRGPEVCVGYALDEHNLEAFDEDGFFHTGDLARQTPEGCLIITGRKKDIIIRGGENLSPKEIEDVLYTHPSVREAAVVAMPHPRLGETCCAFVTLKVGASFDFAAMQALLSRSGLARQKHPERLEIVETLPYTAAGKIRKNLLRDQIKAQVVREQVSPLNARA